MKKVKSRQPPATLTGRVGRAAAGTTGGASRTKGQKTTGRAGPAKAAAKSGGKSKRTGAPGGKAIARPNARKKSPGSAPRTGSGRSAKVARPKPPALQIRKLDPLRICGGGTTVVQLFRVDEQLVGGKAAGARQVHLVFNDRHGWYCEHGRSCHAVIAVMRHARIR